MAINLSILFLSILIIYGAIFFVKVIAQADHVFQLRAMMMLMYLIVNILSGIVHLMKIPGADRGYYDMLVLAKASNELSLFIPIVCSMVGGAFLIIGLSINRKVKVNNFGKINPLDSWSKKTLLIFSIIFAPLSLYAIVLLNRYVEQESIRRLISLSDGMARYAFMAHWFVWVVSFFAIWLSTKSPFKSSRVKGVLLAFSVFAIFVSLRWTGGRTIGILLSLPLIIIFFSTMMRHKVKITLAYLSAVILYGIYLTEYRKENYSSGGFNIISSIDWEFGKFSMMGFAVDYVNKYGYSFGETIYAGAFSIPYAVLKLFGLADGLWVPRLVTELTGKYILGNNALTYIVPGFTAEMYLNFGLFGVAIGYYILGRFACYIEYRFVSEDNLLKKFAFCYFGVILVFCTISAQSGSFFGYIFFSGFPVLLILFLVKIRRLSYS